MHSSSPHWKSLKQFNETVIEHLKPPNGVTHLEVIVDRNHRLVFLEIAARPPGGLMNDIYKRQFGIDFYLQYFRLQLGLPLDESEVISDQYYAWAYFPRKAGRVLSFKKLPIDCNYQVTWYIKEGELISSSHGALAFLKSNISAHVILNDADYPTVYDNFQKLKYFEAFEVE